jgi:hypothetical protein
MDTLHTAKFDRINQISQQEKEGIKRNQMNHGYSKREGFAASGSADVDRLKSG